MNTDSAKKANVPSIASVCPITPPAKLENEAQLVPNWNSSGMPVTTPTAKLMSRTVPKNRSISTSGMSVICGGIISPSAKSDAISAQQQPTHQAPCFMPISTAPQRPSRHAPSRKPSGLRHLPRQAFLSGVSS